MSSASRQEAWALFNLVIRDTIRGTLNELAGSDGQVEPDKAEKLRLLQLRWAANMEHVARRANKHDLIAVAQDEWKRVNTVTSTKHLAATVAKKKLNEEVVQKHKNAVTDPEKDGHVEASSQISVTHLPSISKKGQRLPHRSKLKRARRR